MLREGETVAVGVSGGKDSLTLLETLAAMRRFYPKKYEVVAITVDMGFEGMDFSEIEEFCRRINVKYVIEKTDIAKIVFDIRKEAYKTPDFRTALWTGGNLQLTVMTVPVGEEVGIERHDGIDQLVGVVSGAGEVAFGNRENYFAPPVPLDAHSVILIPAGTYHNIKNVGRTPLKLYSVYAPKAHKFGAVDKFNVE